MPGRYDLNLYRGDSYTWRFILWDDDAQTVPTDLTGATVKAEIREKSAGTHVVILTPIITQPNIIDISMTPAMYVDCPVKGVWDFQITYPDGKVHSPIYGDVVVTGDVTDSVVMPVARR